MKPPGGSGAGHLCGDLAGPKKRHGSEPGGTADGESTGNADLFASNACEVHGDFMVI